MTDLCELKYTKREIAAKRQTVTARFTAVSDNVKSRSINAISPADLELLFGLYDEIFFGHRFRRSFKGKPKFSLSRRMTKSAGKTIFPKSTSKIPPGNLTFEIRLGVDFFFDYNALKGGKNVCGIRTKNALEALQLVFEHELCHVIEFLSFGKSSCSRDRFKTIARNLFGHTESYHMLPTGGQIAVLKYGLKIGQEVFFMFENKKIKGKLYSINKRATVMVRDNDGTFVDSRGDRYAKYYVPLPLLMIR